MTHTAKLLPLLLLGSALSGCSMAGMGDYFGSNYVPSQQGYLGESSYCGEQPTQHIAQEPACGSAYSSTPSQVASQTYSQPYSQSAVAPVAQSYSHPAPSYTQPAQNTYYTDQNAYQGQAPYQAAPTYQGQQGYYQNGYATSPYVNARGGSSRGLRQSYTYGTLGATLYDVDSDLYGIQGRLGWQSKGIFGAEVEGSLGVSDDDGFVDFGGGFIPAQTEIDTQIAVFGVARYPVSNKLNVLGRVGYHHTDHDARSDNGVSVIETEFSTDGVAYGAGVEYALNPITSVRADYTRYDLDGPEADAVSLAVLRKF